MSVGRLCFILQICWVASGLGRRGQSTLESDKTGDAIGRLSWGSSLLGAPGVKFFMTNRRSGTKRKQAKNKATEAVWKLIPQGRRRSSNQNLFDQLCGAGGEEVVQ
jgi:hypothetical protein